MVSSVVLTALVATALADFGNNVNFASPSRSHPDLGMDMEKIFKRTAEGSKPWSPDQLNFTHGVASGDPFPDSVILWTRASPTLANDNSNVTVSGAVPLYNHDTASYIEASANPVCVNYVVATDNKLTKVVTKGTAYTVSDIDYTVKVEAQHLKPFTTYYYQFNICNSTKKSPLGRTKTSPTPTDDVSALSLAVFSCSNFPNGFFNAYGNAARKDNVDYFVHLGDYLYEYGPSSNNASEALIARAGRSSNPKKEIASLYDYRTRHAQYKTDQDLLLAHQNFPWIPVWDDHEIANNGYKDGFSGMNNTEASFIKFGGISVDQRKMNAVRAYFEWMPIRQVDMDDNLRIWRSFQLGKLLDLIMLDTRYYDRSVTSLGWNDEYVEKLENDAGRSLMGSHQENWFYRTLSESQARGATWRVIGNQIVFSRINITSWYGSVDSPFNTDQWDGYMANRNRTLAHLYDNKINNNIMLSGDSHNNWVSDLTYLDEVAYDPVTGANSIGVEFAGTAVTSGGIGGTIAEANAQSKSLQNDNKELQWQEGYYRGYFELHITPQTLTAQYYGCPTVRTRNPFDISLANFTVKAGANRLTRPIAGGKVENGVLQRGKTVGTNLTLNTNTGKYFISKFNQMFIVPDH